MTLKAMTEADSHDALARITAMIDDAIADYAASEGRTIGAAYMHAFMAILTVVGEGDHCKEANATTVVMGRMLHQASRGEDIGVSQLALHELQQRMIRRLDGEITLEVETVLKGIITRLN